MTKDQLIFVLGSVVAFAVVTLPAQIIFQMVIFAAVVSVVAKLSGSKSKCCKQDKTGEQ